MNWQKHYNLINQHAFLSPSKAHWINYTEEKLVDVYLKNLAVKRGTLLHALASNCIRLGVKLPSNKKSINQFVNDAIGFRMMTEVVLFYSMNAFGTADAISFRNNFLRIHDLKTGTLHVKMTQLEIYAALFCLEYEVKPTTIDIELRVYQSSNIVIHNPEAAHIKMIMEKIIFFDKRIEELKKEEENPWQPF